MQFNNLSGRQSDARRLRDSKKPGGHIAIAGRRTVKQYVPLAATTQIARERNSPDNPEDRHYNDEVAAVWFVEHLWTQHE
jgi:hypothetical protein